MNSWSNNSDLNFPSLTVQIRISGVLRSPYLRKLVLFCSTQYYSNGFVNELMVCVPSTYTFCSRAHPRCGQWKGMKISRSFFSHSAKLLKDLECSFEFDLFAHCTFKLHIWAWLSENVVNLFSESFSGLFIRSVPEV